MVAAKTLAAHQKLIELFSNRKIEKLYLAVCHGRPASQIINMPIGRNPSRRKEMTVLPDGKDALTEIQVAAFNEKMSLVLAKPRTGRTHQIRVHLKALGCPVLGDAIYAKPDPNGPERQLLHAYKLSFDHPITNAPIRLIAPIPADMKTYLQKLCGPSLCASAIN